MERTTAFEAENAGSSPAGGTIPRLIARYIPEQQVSSVASRGKTHPLDTMKFPSERRVGTSALTGIYGSISALRVLQLVARHSSKVQDRVRISSIAPGLRVGK